MELRPLGRTGVQVSSLCLGCMMFGRRTEPEESYAIIDRALDAGINFLDTANVYALGRSEEITGEALKRNGQRQNVVLATKVHGQMDAEDPNARGNSRRHIIEQCEASLRRLQTDYIDLYQLHRPQPDIPIDETLRALDDLIRDGKVRYIGTSNFAGWELVESLWVAKELGLNRVVCEQPAYNLLDRRVESELLPAARTFGIAVIPWGPLGGGLLSGRYQRGEPLPADGRYALNQRQQERVTDGVFDVIEGLTPIAQEKGCTSLAALPGLVRAAARSHQPDHRPKDHGAARRQPRLSRRHHHRRRPRTNRRHQPSRLDRDPLLRTPPTAARVSDSVVAFRRPCEGRDDEAPKLARSAIASPSRLLKKGHVRLCGRC